MVGGWGGRGVTILKLGNIMEQLLHSTVKTKSNNEKNGAF